MEAGPLPDCGTMRGVYQHRKRNEKPCIKCRQARADYQRERYNATKKTCKRGHRLVDKVGGKRQCKECHQLDARICGTYAGVAQHQRHGIPLCEPCRLARNEYARTHKYTGVHQKCGREYTHFDSIGRPYCPDCKYRSRSWITEARSLRSLAYTNKEIAAKLGVDVKTVELKLAA